MRIAWCLVFPRPLFGSNCDRPSVAVPLNLYMPMEGSTNQTSLCGCIFATFTSCASTCCVYIQIATAPHGHHSPMAAPCEAVFAACVSCGHPPPIHASSPPQEEPSSPAVAVAPAGDGEEGSLEAGREPSASSSGEPLLLFCTRAQGLRAALRRGESHLVEVCSPPVTLGASASGSALP